MNVVQRERRLHIEERNTVLGIQADHVVEQQTVRRVGFELVV
jgi:hypothetical protein